MTDAEHCGSSSGEHDDGDPITCEQPAGHSGAHTNDGYYRPSSRWGWLSDGGPVVQIAQGPS